MDAQSPKVGQIERKTQNRIVALFRDRLNYDYLGYWEDRDGNSNIEETSTEKQPQSPWI